MTETTYEVPTVTCEPGAWRDTLEHVRGDGFDFFDFLTAVDQTDTDESPGFDVVVHLYDITPPARCARPSCRPGRRRRVAAQLHLAVAGAAWHERETHEMFGIGFDGYSDANRGTLRKLLLPDGFDGTPLRKVVRAGRPCKQAVARREGTRRRRHGRQAGSCAASADAAAGCPRRILGSEVDGF